MMDKKGNIRRLKLFIVIFCLAFTVSAALPNNGLAAMYYLDAVNGNDSNPGTEARPWQTMAKVETAAQAGDTVVILNVHEDTFTATWPEGIIYQAPGVTQFGITWTFDKNYTIGRFANGDFWVVGPVTIIGIDPDSTEIDGRTKNGSMVNPSPGDGYHGYDSGTGGYNSAYNVALDVSASNPLVIQANSSLVSTISVEQADSRPQVKVAAVLTVIDSTASEGSFRPPYSGTDKTIKFDKNQLDYSNLSNLTAPASVPRLEQQPGDVQAASAERMFERVWLDHWPSWSSRNFHPADNMPDYGRDMTRQIGDAALMLNLDYTNTEKETLLIRFVQLGIDLYGVLQDGGENNWINRGGHQCGRKLPILFAGIVLDDSDMKSIGNKSGDYLYSDGYGSGNLPPDYIHFQEDDQTFYAKPADVFPQPYALYVYSDVYRTSDGHGTVSVTNGSRIVTLTGWSWAASSDVRYFGVEGDNRAYSGNEGGYAIESLDSPTQLTLAIPYEGETATDKAYGIGYFIWYGHGSGKEVDYEEYTAQHLGLPEWGIRHSTQYIWDGLDWDASYRILNSYALGGYVLAAHIIGAKTLWNHNALFDYMDRYMAIEQGNPNRQLSDFADDMWDTYRADYGCVYIGLDTTTHKRIYNCAGATVDCGQIATCSEYSNPTAAECDPCNLGCSVSSLLYGDVSGNGTISAMDAALAAQYSVGLISLTEEQITKADVTGNGTVSATDAAWIARKAVGLVDKFPVEQ